MLKRTRRPTSSSDSAQKQGVTPRAVALGLFCRRALRFTPYNDFAVAATYISGNQFPIGALFILFFFSLAVNGFLRRFAPLRVFRPAELLTIWTLILVASGIPSSGMMRYLIPNIAAPQYLSTATNGWEEKVWGADTPSWLRLSDPAAAQAFISGYTRGQEKSTLECLGDTALFWGILAGLFTVATFCFSNMLRRQWIENERFAFPLVALPVLLSAEPPPGHRVNDLFRNPLFWIAVALVTVYHTIRGVHLLYPSVPDIPRVFDLGTYITTSPWNRIGALELYFFPIAIGLAFLLPLDVCFSLWFFYLFYKMQLVLAGYYNYETQGPIISYEANLFHGLEAFGGGLALLSWVAWTGRQHFRDIWEKATDGPRAAMIDDSGEMFSYRATVLGLAVSYGGIALWLYAAGVPGLYTVSTLLMLTLALTVVSWLVSQAGMLFAQQPYGTLDMLAPTLGTASLKISALYTMTRFEFSFLYDTREMLTPSLLIGAKVGEAGEINLRSLFRAMVASVVIGIIVSAAVSVMLPYLNGGGDNLKNPFMYRQAPSRPLTFLAGIASVPYKGTWTNSLHILGGYAGVLALFIVRARFGFGLHPIGFLVASVWAIRCLWTSIFVGWVAKSIIQRYSGMRGFQTALPFFLGLILGDVLNAIIWIALGYATGVGYQVTPD